MATDWLKTYYGKDFPLFNPTIVLEGAKFAVVKLIRPTQRPYSGMGFVLIKKTGRHNVSVQKSLHEGPINDEDYKRLQATLDKAEMGEK